jgi:hypothetical protein
MAHNTPQQIIDRRTHTMTIARVTRIQAYQLRKGGTQARLAILRMIAADSVNNRNPHARLQSGDWRKARTSTLKSYSAAFCQLSQGSNDGEPVWYGHTGENFRNERYSYDVIKLRHTGWFCDVDQDSTARGFIAGLSHGRFIAGYELSDSGERVYFGQVFTDEHDAARMGDEHARVIADRMREDSERFYAARKIEDDIEDNTQRLRECLALRNNPCFQALRDEAREVLETIRKARETLRTDYAGVL